MVVVGYGLSLAMSAAIVTSTLATTAARGILISYPRSPAVRHIGMF